MSQSNQSWMDFSMSGFVRPVSQQVPGTEEEPPIELKFDGEIASIRSLIPALKAICIKRQAMLAFTSGGIRFSSEEDSKAFQASVFISHEMFNKYELRDGVTENVCFQMDDFMSALTILLPENLPLAPLDNENYTGSNEEMLRIKYDRRDRIKLQVVSGTHQAMAYVKTYNPLDLMIYSMAFVNRIVIDAAVLIDFWKCADTRSPFVELTLHSADGPYLKMCTESERGRFENQIFADSVHVAHFECAVPTRRRYKMDAMKFTLRALLLASKVSIRMDSEGLLNLQFLVRIDANLAEITGRNITSHRADPIASARTAALGATTFLTDPSDVPKCFVEFFILPMVQIA